MITPFGTFALPTDVPTWTAFALALLALGLAIWAPQRARACSRWAMARPKVTTLALAALATLLSVLYVQYYLRGGPRIIDATSYWLQARVLSDGAFTFSLTEPTGSFRGRFLLTSESDPTRAGVIFPPGYPLILALGFVLRAPMLVGPLTAAALVAATYALTLRLSGQRRVALAAGLLSTLNAALSYHTADTMSHGWSALLLTSGLAAALTKRPVWALAAGLAAGWLLATRPVTGVVGVFAIALALWLGQRDKAARNSALFATGLLPGIVLFLTYQHALTGSWLEWAQPQYYLRADGPPGCFRYGFGHGIGCLFEHGDFVRTRLPEGHTLSSAALATLRRLALHMGDITNLLLLAPLVIVGAIWTLRRTPQAWALIGAIGGVIVGYAPFYFDGNYPGGGARFFADILPLEHALVAVALARLRLVRFVPALALFGFAFHVGHDHARLRDREGGRPMFEASLLTNHGIKEGLVFVRTDHGFNLGHDPNHHEPFEKPLIARGYGDGHDRWLWESLGRPKAYLYLYDPFSPFSVPRIEAYTPPHTLRFEAEAEWPPLSVQRGWSHPGFTAASCAPSGRGLRLKAPETRLTVPLVRPAHSKSLEVRFVADEPTSVAASVGGQERRARQVGCFSIWLELPARDEALFLEVTSKGNALLDFWVYRSAADP